jgi:hypothetical protein
LTFTGLVHVWPPLPDDDSAIPSARPLGAGRRSSGTRVVEYRRGQVHSTTRPERHPRVEGVVEPRAGAAGQARDYYLTPGGAAIEAHPGDQAAEPVLHPDADDVGGVGRVDRHVGLDLALGQDLVQVGGRAVSKWARARHLHQRAGARRPCHRAAASLHPSARGVLPRLPGATHGRLEQSLAVMELAGSGL